MREIKIASNSKYHVNDTQKMLTPLMDMAGTWLSKVLCTQTGGLVAVTPYYDH